jgi:hypothetical protein
LPKQIDIARHFGARPHQTHVADNNVNQLRQLVDLASAQKPPQARYAGIFTAGNRAPHSFCVLHHCAKFEKLKRPTSTPDSPLSKHDTSRRIKRDRQGNG